MEKVPTAGAGTSICQLGGDSKDPNPQCPEKQVYDAVEALFPGDAPGDKFLRRKLLAGQPWAAAHARTAQSELASIILELTAEYCAKAAFKSPVTTDQLCNDVQGFRHLRMAADCFNKGGGA